MAAKLVQGKDCTSAPNNCDTNLYCTPSILGERHCCSLGQKWVVDRYGKGQCTGSQGCENIGRGRINNCINAIKSTLIEKGKRNFVEGVSYLTQECITSGQVCCEVDLGGVKSTEFVNKGDCIKA